MAQKIENGYWKAYALSAIASALVEAGDKEQALATLKQAVAATQIIENAIGKADVLRGIALVQAKAGDKEQALATLKQALEVAQKIEDARRKATALRAIAMTLTTEPLRENKKDNPDRPVERRMKKAFTPKEKQLAKQLVEAMQGN